MAVEDEAESTDDVDRRTERAAVVVAAAGHHDPGFQSSWPRPASPNNCVNEK